MTLYVLRHKWWRIFLDWLAWYGPGWLARKIPNWGLYREEIDADSGVYWFSEGGMTWTTEFGENDA